LDPAPPPPRVRPESLTQIRSASAAEAPVRMRPTAVLLRQAMIKFRHGRCNAHNAAAAHGGGSPPAAKKAAAPKPPHVAKPLGPNVTMVYFLSSSPRATLTPLESRPRGAPAPIEEGYAGSRCCAQLARCELAPGNTLGVVKCAPNSQCGAGVDFLNHAPSRPVRDVLGVPRSR
jgi:hypothetical protein